MKKATLENKVDGLVVTVQKLAERMNSGFDRADKNLEKLAEKIDSGFARVEEKFEGVGQQFESLAERIDGRIDNLEISINKRFFEVNDHLGGLENKFGNIENLYTDDREEHKIFRDKLGLLRKTA